LTPGGSLLVTKTAVPLLETLTPPSAIEPLKKVTVPVVPCNGKFEPIVALRVTFGIGSRLETAYVLDLPLSHVPLSVGDHTTNGYRQGIERMSNFSRGIVLRLVLMP
jgi:hypothetical protein